jgi:cell division protein FtsB
MNDEVLAVLDSLRGEIAAQKAVIAALQTRSNAQDIEIEDLHKQHKEVNKDLVVFATREVHGTTACCWGPGVQRALCHGHERV